MSQEAAEAYFQAAQEVFTSKSGASSPELIAEGAMQPSNVPEPLSQPKPEIASIKFTFAMAYELAHSSDPYPVDLEDVIAWGLSEAKTDRFARRYLKDLILETFTEGQDFMHDFSVEKHNNPVAHRPLPKARTLCTISRLKSITIPLHTDR